MYQLDPIKKEFTNSILMSTVAGEETSSHRVTGLILASEDVSFLRKEPWDLEYHGYQESL